MNRWVFSVCVCVCVCEKVSGNLRGRGRCLDLIRFVLLEGESSGAKGVFNILTDSRFIFSTARIEVRKISSLAPLAV